MEKPMVSIIMATHNTPELYLREAIESIINQSYKNFEFIIINDASTDNANEIINSYIDNRIIIVNNKYNLGLTKSLNKGIEISNGDFIARMDSDDISLSQRLERQVESFLNNPKINVLGTRAMMFGDKSKLLKCYLKDTQEKQKIKLFYYNIGFIHPTVMFRKSFLDANKIIYDIRLKKTQDYGLWVECVNYSKLDILDEVLLHYRTHSSQISQANASEQSIFGSMVRWSQLNNIGIEVTDQVKDLHSSFCDGMIYKDINATRQWVTKLIESNNISGTYNKKLFIEETKYIWFLLCLKEFAKNKNIKIIPYLLVSFRTKYVIEYFKYHKSRY